MADEVKSVKDEMNGKSELLPAKWNRFTVADGDWMQSKTLQPLTARDDFLAEQIDKSTTDWQDALSSESATRYSDDQYLSASISSLSGEFYTFSADDYYPTVTALRYDLNSEIDRATQAETTLSGRISLEETTRSAEDVKLQKQIDELQAATDVIAVFGTYPEFTAASAGAWQEQVTDNDFIKVLRDSAYNPTGDDDADTSDDDYYQVYYQWHISAHDGWDGWSAIGNLDPYYSVAEIDEYKEEVADEFDNLTYVSGISASDTEIGFDFHKGAGNQTTFKIKQGPNIAFTSGVNELTISALPGTKTYNIDDSKIQNAMFWDNDNYHAAYDFLAGEAGDWSTMDEIIDCFNNNIPVYINEYNEANVDNYSNYNWKLNTIHTFTADNKKHIKFTFENEHEETNYYGVIEWYEGAYGPVVDSYSGISKSTLLHDTNLSGDGSPTNALGLNSAVNVYVPLVQEQNLSANVQIGYTPNNLPFNGLYQKDYVGVSLNRNYGLNNDIGFQLDEYGLHLNSLYAPSESTVTSYATHFTMNEYFTLYSAYWNTHYKNITAFNENGSEEPIRLNELKLSAGKGLSFTMTDRSNWSPAATWRPPEAPWNNVSGYTKLALSVDDSIISSAELGKAAYETLTAAKISANSSPAFTGLLSAGFRISAGNNLIITTTSNNTIQLNAKDTGITSVSAGGNIGGGSKNFTTTIKLSAGDGIKFITGDNDLLGISAGGVKYQDGNCISINENNEINLTPDVLADRIYMSDGGTINFDDNDNYKAYLNKNSLDFSGTGNFGGINTAHYGIDYIYLSSNGTPGSEAKFLADSVSGKYMNQTYSVNWRNLASAAKLVPGSAISFITNASNETEITMSAIQAQTAYISTYPSTQVITKNDTVTSLKFTPAWYGGVTLSHSWIGISANNSALGVLTPEPNSLMNNQQKRMLVHYWENNDRGTIGWQDVSSVMNNLNYISGNGTITAMVTATQPGSNANVLYLV